MVADRRLALPARMALALRPVPDLLLHWRMRCRVPHCRLPGIGQLKQPLLMHSQLFWPRRLRLSCRVRARRKPARLQQRLAPSRRRLALRSKALTAPRHRLECNCPVEQRMTRMEMADLRMQFRATLHVL